MALSGRMEIRKNIYNYTNKIKHNHYTENTSRFNAPTLHRINKGKCIFIITPKRYFTSSAKYLTDKTAEDIKDKLDSSREQCNAISNDSFYTKKELQDAYLTQVTLLEDVFGVRKPAS